jgi:hypothetical protein
MQRLWHGHRVTVMLSVAAILIVLVAWVFTSRPMAEIDSYAACTAAGYPVAETNPPICQSPKRAFVGPVASIAPSTEASQGLPFDLLVDADSHSTYPRYTQVIKTQADWQSFWAQIHASIAMPPILAVDFSTSMVVALSEGVGLAGRHFAVSSVNQSDHGTVVMVTETTPIACAEPTGTTNPYYLIRTGRLSAPVTFQVTPATHQCTY